MIAKGTDSIASNVDLLLCDSQTKHAGWENCDQCIMTLRSLEAMSLFDCSDALVNDSFTSCR